MKIEGNKTFGERGQSTVEFIFTFIFIVGMLFLFLKIALIYTNGYFVHYVTFQASRAYMTYDTHAAIQGADAGAKNQALAVFNSYPISPLLGESVGTLELKNPEEAGAYPIHSGAIYSYETTFGISDFLGGKIPLKFVSESFLGREPVRIECAMRTCDAIKATGASCESFVEVTIFDNGC